MRDYATEVERLRSTPYARECERVRIIGTEAIKRGYPFAIGQIGYVVDTITHGYVREFKVFTGTRIWHVPERDVEVLG